MDRIEKILRDQREELLATDFSQFVPRQEEALIDLDSRLAQIVIGVRRCGKSTLCQKVLVKSCDFNNPKAKLYNREIGGLIKGSAATNCNDLTLIMMSGETGDLVVEGKTIHRVLASDWLLGRG